MPLKFVWSLLSLFASCSALLDADEEHILVALYDATNGAHWNDKWDLEKDLCGQYGVTCNEQGDSVDELDLYHNSLNGTIPSVIAQLPNLRFLVLNSNEDLHGTIPSEFGLMTQLMEINLHGCPIEGSIPCELGQLSQLAIVRLYENELSGEIPTEFGQMSSLEILQLFGNNLTGTLPTEFGLLSELTFLTVEDNSLSGSIPTEFGMLQKCQTLYLGDNDFTGTLPTEIGNMVALWQLILENNNFSGMIPTEIGRPPFELLKLGNNELTGKIPTEIAGLSNLNSLYLENNMLSGSVPSGILELEYLNELFLSGNCFSSVANYSLIEKNDYSVLLNETCGEEEEKESEEQRESEEGPDCFRYTTYGPMAQRTCVFPFIYDGVTYFDCTTVDRNIEWCATSVSVRDMFIENEWGYCNACDGEEDNFSVEEQHSEVDSTISSAMMVAWRSNTFLAIFICGVCGMFYT